MDSFVRKFVDGLSICTLIKVCNDTNEYESIDDFAQRILGDRPEPNITKKIKNEKTKNADDYIKVIQFTDIHLDMYYKEGTPANCQYPLCCHELADDDLVPYKYKVAGLYGTIASCDINIETVKAFAAKAKEVNPDYIMFTGDIIAHSVWTVKQEEVTKAAQMAVNAIQEQFGLDTPVFPAIGNHEKAPVDEFHGDETELLTGLAEVFKPYLDDQAYISFKKYGYYSMLYKNTKLRIVSLNCLVCDSFNFNLLYDRSQARLMSNWLEKVLDNAEKNGETVHIMDHIPMQNNQHSIDCSARLKILMDRYQHIIKGYFSGHTHNEFSTVVHQYYNKTNPILMNYVCAGLTTYSDYQPSFRMYLIDKEEYFIQDYIQYRMNLTQSNELRTPVWFISYNATNLFNVNSLNDVESISKYEITPEYVQHTYTDVPGSEERSKSEGAIKNAKCHFINDNIEDLMDCTGYSTFSGSYLNYMLKDF